MICVKYRKDLPVLYGPVAHNIRKMIHVKYLQDQLALRPFRIHVKLNILKNFFMIPDTRVKYCKDLQVFTVFYKTSNASLRVPFRRFPMCVKITILVSPHSLRTMVSVCKGVLYVLVKRCV